VLYDESRELEISCGEAVADHLTVRLFQSEAAFYRNYPTALDAGLPVPDVWHSAYARSGGKYIPQLPASVLEELKLPVTAPQTRETLTEARSQAQAMMASDFLELDQYGLVDNPQALNSEALYRDVDSLMGDRPMLEDVAVLKGDREVDTSWVNALLENPYVLIYGAPGSGKTTFVQWLINQRIALGHTVFALDPHYEAGSWQNCEIKGCGLNYAEIDDFIAHLDALVKQRYVQRQHTRGLVFQPITVICEELTRWAKKCKKVQDLIEGIPDYRKVGVHLLLVAHGRSLPSLGGTKGNRDVLDESLTELKLLAKRGANGKSIPLKRGVLKVDDERPREVLIPDIDIEPLELSNQQVEPAETQSGQEFQNIDDPPEPVREPQENPLEPALLAHPLEPEPESETEEIVTPLEKSQFVKLKEKGMNKAQIIDFIWDCKKGKSRRYEEASKKYDLLLADWESTEAVGK